ncbi:MAG: hypothetical protein DLM65_04395 [Candidatus Aeolococcus gillhamiae]|uniref:Uncharacterized protein n=1 Tax=Candidatus Aeolococcus gillhamiae TaxID=3127015 RepID=A0A2W5ZHD4_9BACT|nr:MAG: hypothetical protein DLM65_04395 [Candidatus Dormibacter sp. RRmetagenome_bin12]
MTTRPDGAPSLWARLAAGVACAAAVGLALTPLIPHDTAGQSAPGTSSSAPVGSPASNSATLCPTPSISTVTTETTPGSGVYTAPPADPKGVWVQVTGTNLVSPVCQRSVYVGTVQQPGDQNTPGPVTPPSPAASPTPTTSPSRASSPTPSPTAPPPDTETLYFSSNGDSGPVSVHFADPRHSSAPVLSNNNFTFLSPPVITGMSTQTPSESAYIALAGTGFTMGGLNPMTGVTYYQGPASSEVGCDAVAAVFSDDAHMTLNAPTTYCNGDVVVTFETQLDTRYPISSSNMNIIEAATPQPIQVRGVVSSILPKQPSPGATMYVIGSGFGATSGTATLNGSSLQVISWNDRVVSLVVAKDATSGSVVLTRYDGTTVPIGGVTLVPPALAFPGGSSAAAAAAAAASAAAKKPIIFGLPVPPSRPLSGGETVTGQLNPAPSLSPFVNNINYTTTPVGFAPFAVLAAIVLIAAFILGFVQAGLFVLFARRSRRIAAAARAAAENALVERRRGRELRLGRHVRNVEVIGRAAPIGHLLLRAGAIDRHALREALHQHRTEGRPLGEVLVARGAASEKAVWGTLGDQWGISLGDLENHWVDVTLAQRLPAVDAIRYRVLLVRGIGETVVVAMADPFDTRARLHVERVVGLRVVPILATPSAIRRRQEQVYSAALLDESVESLQRAHPEASAHLLLTRRQRITAVMGGVLAISLAVVFGGPFFIGVAGFVVGLYAVVVVFRAYVIVRGSKFLGVVDITAADLAALTDLPIYTILCPLYREAGVLPQLVEACAALDYPASLLDIKLLLEADDIETLNLVLDYPLPGNFDVIVVPAEGPRTKPKACNYGLQFARGEYVVIFDAEDIPEPDQLKKAIATFRRSGPSVGCVQAKLNFYNPRQNALTSWFALEYTAWFDFFLPGLVDLGLPVPLGGSSNHFPTALLRHLNAWDPNNVTEDADLGIRLHRAGYRTVIMSSTTLEEANSDFVNWVKQRSRWGKGYAVSWLVQMRHPVTLYRLVGWKSFISVHLTLGGTFGVSVLNLAVWLLTLLWALAQFNFIAYLFPSAIYYVGMLELLVGNFFFLYMGVWSCQHRKSWELTRVALLAPAYWLMMSLAMLKAGLQLVTKPTYWEKTVHGLFDNGSVVQDVALVGTSAPTNTSAPVLADEAATSSRAKQ